MYGIITELGCPLDLALGTLSLERSRGLKGYLERWPRDERKWHEAAHTAESGEAMRLGGAGQRSPQADARPRRKKLRRRRCDKLARKPMAPLVGGCDRPEINHAVGLAVTNWRESTCGSGIAVAIVQKSITPLVRLCQVGAGLVSALVWL